MKNRQTQQYRPTIPPLLSKWDYWRVCWLTLVCTSIKLVTFARWLPQWDTWWKMAVLEKRSNDRDVQIRSKKRSDSPRKIDAAMARLDQRLRSGLRQRLSAQDSETEV